MSATTAVFTTDTVSTSRRPSLDTQMRASLEHARRLTAMYEPSSIEVAIAWEVVDELRLAYQQQRGTVQSAFAQYCLANPDAPECRIYED
ncbi:hypothetical protein IQ254_22075 [Nodosilinea sp. LEGE 07088]|uniref:Calvin cycle protein CP12 n=1 Tax=Nodosilinea sp. LEGE 07088 TaxID=2777968 RepID=UPI001880D59D|nr:Calvin cycle protein CP12 [Nodosilinea sp. LEGE 07088]MBE9139850.1 hypothetical protein [Nodosilinea sp. LEGE 07088]